MQKRTILFILAIILLTACSQQPRTPGYLNLRLSSDPTTLDPAMIEDTASGSIAAKLFNGLVRFDQNAGIIPDVATSWELSKDGKTYTFHLRKGVNFSTGRNLTARDFKYSFTRVLSPKTKSSRTWLFDRIVGAKPFMDGTAADVAGIRVPDDYTLVIELEAPFGPFLGLLAMPGAYAVPSEAVEKSGEHFGDNPVGTGPYTLGSWEHGSGLTLLANPGYFDAKPKLSGVAYRIIPEDLTSVAEFERGNLDVLGIPAPEYRRYTEDPRWKDHVISQVGMNTFYLGLNCSKPPFNDPLVRKAVSMAIDRERILNTVYERRGQLAEGPSPSVLYKNKYLGTAPYNYSPQEARNLLKSAGYQDTLAVKIYIGADQDTLDMVEIIQQYLAEVGIHASIVQLEWSAYKQAIVNGDADAFWLSWQADYPDPENFLYPVFFSGNFGSKGNRARFKDDQFDALIQQAQAEPDAGRREALYQKAQSRVVELAPWVFFWHKKEFVVVQPGVRGFRLYPINNADKGLDVWVEAGAGGK